MRFTLSLRNYSLGLAATSFLLAGSALAQQNQPNMPNQSTYNQARNVSAQTSYNKRSSNNIQGQDPSGNTYKLAGVKAKLDHAISSKNAHPGQIVEAKLQGSVTTPDGVKLPDGSELRGEVEQAQKSQNDSPAKISIVFNQAKLNDGRTIPVHVIVVAAYPPVNPMAGTFRRQMMGPTPNTIPSDQKVDQKAGLLSNVAMHSDMHNHHSATFIDRDGNFTLRAGTRFQLGIASENGSATRAGM
jgi:hypothetical protein